MQFHGEFGNSASPVADKLLDCIMANSARRVDVLLLDSVPEKGDFDFQRNS